MKVSYNSISFGNTISWCSLSRKRLNNIRDFIVVDDGVGDGCVGVFDVVLCCWNSLREGVEYLRLLLLLFTVAMGDFDARDLIFVVLLLLMFSFLLLVLLLCVEFGDFDVECTRSIVLTVLSLLSPIVEFQGSQ